MKSYKDYRSSIQFFIDIDTLWLIRIQDGLYLSFLIKRFQFQRMHGIPYFHMLIT